MNPEAPAFADPWLDALPAALRQRLLHEARPLALRAGQRLFARGDASDGLYRIEAGLMRFTGLTVDGHEAILAICDAPQWFGEIALFDHEPRTHDAWAETDARLLHVPQPALDTLLAAEPAHWRCLGLLLTQKLRASFVVVESLVLLSPTARVAGRLALMATGHGALDGGGSNGARLLRISQQQLGLMLALSRQTVNQALKGLEAAGAIRRSRGAIEVTSLAALRRCAA